MSVCFLILQLHRRHCAVTLASCPRWKAAVNKAEVPTGRTATHPQRVWSWEYQPGQRWFPGSRAHFQMPLKFWLATLTQHTQLLSCSFQSMDLHVAEKDLNFQVKMCICVSLVSADWWTCKNMVTFRHSWLVPGPSSLPGYPKRCWSGLRKTAGTIYT